MTKARGLAELANVYDDSALGNRNMVINGSMAVAQRGISQTAAGYGTLDRFQLSLSGASATMTQESFTIGQTDVPGSDKYLKLVVSTGNNNSGIYHKVEAKNAFPAIGQKVTLSYFAKGTSPAAGLEVAIRWYDGSSTSSLASTTVTLTSSWTKYTHTFDVPSISGLTLTNAAAYLEVHWIQANADTSSNAYEINLAQTQLEVGDTATPFEHRSYGAELVSCLRYFEKFDYANTQFVDSIGTANTTSTANCMLSYSTKRTAPTITLPPAGTSGGKLAFLTGGGGYPSTVGTLAVQLPSITSARIFGTGFGGYTIGQSSGLFASGSCSITIDSEL
jgi:hypothetical protein